MMSISPLKKDIHRRLHKDPERSISLHSFVPKADNRPTLVTRKKFKVQNQKKPMMYKLIRQTIILYSPIIYNIRCQYQY